MVFSPAGLMEKDTAQEYKRIQGLIGPGVASWLDLQLSLILARSRAIYAQHSYSY
jgi:hypothetical protein